MEGLAEALADPELKGVFESQFVENRSHINMGRRVVEEFIEQTRRCRAVPLGLRGRQARLQPVSWASSAPSSSGKSRRRRRRRGVQVTD